MLTKISEPISSMGIGLKVAAMSKEEMKEVLISATPEDIKKVTEMLRGKRSAASAPQTAATIMTILAILFGKGLAGTPSGEDVAKKLEELSGKKKIEQIVDFKADLPKETMEVDQKILDDFNKLITVARRAEVKPGFSGTPLKIGDKTLIPKNKEEMEALKALGNIMKTLAKAATSPESKKVYDAKIKVLVDSFESKKPAKFS